MTTSCGHHHEDGGSHELVVKDLTMEYRGHVALDGVSFNARCGSSLALVGPNGAGKSTLLKGIAGLKSLRRGNITWAGEHHINCRGGEFAYLPQQEEVNWQFPITVRGVVEMGRYTQLGKFGRFGAKDMASVDAALDLMELNEELAGRQISELSGGQRQRAFIARAIAQEAHVLLLDEPFTGLDRVHTANLTRLLRKLARENRLVIASHHDVNTLADIFDQVLLLNRALIDFGACTEVLTEENLAKTFQTSTHV